VVLDRRFLFAHGLFRTPWWMEHVVIPSETRVLSLFSIFFSATPAPTAAVLAH